MTKFDEKALAARITDYLANGGLFNPESMEHDKIRDLLIDYRIAPKPELTQDTIPWDAIDERFQWAARDADGVIFAYVIAPKRTEAYWQTHDDDLCLTDYFAGVSPGTVDWRDSLQQRPAAEEKRP